jgi:hypothetical protein
MKDSMSDGIDVNVLTAYLPLHPESGSDVVT